MSTAEAIKKLDTILNAFKQMEADQNKAIRDYEDSNAKKAA